MDTDAAAAQAELILQGAEAVRYAQRPESLKGLRACTSCKLVKTLLQFEEAFCENCWPDWANGSSADALTKKDRAEAAHEHTTTDYEGLTAMMRPTDSWAARWMRMHKADETGAREMLKPGLYAVSLPGVEARARASRRHAAAVDEADEDEDEGDDEGALVAAAPAAAAAAAAPAAAAGAGADAAPAPAVAAAAAAAGDDAVMEDAAALPPAPAEGPGLIADAALLDGASDV